MSGRFLIWKMQPGRTLYVLLPTFPPNPADP
jgi:hypothetical protein